ncbi:hypothetical protein RI367_002505 [Sorochytrium milnesiophthora]
MSSSLAASSPLNVKLPPLVGNTKLVVGLVFGASCGFFQIMGAPALVSFVALATVAGSVALQRTSMSMDDLESKVPLVMEGFMPSLALFVLTWTATYNALHAPAMTVVTAAA